MFALFSNRELAYITFILLALMSVFKDCQSFCDVLNAFKNQYIIISMCITIIYFAFIAFILYCISNIISFDKSLLIKNSIVWFMTSGISLVVCVITVDKSFLLQLRKWLFNWFGALNISIFIMSQYSFSFWIELVIAFILYFCVIKQHQKIISFIILVMMINSIYHFFNDINIDVTNMVMQYALPIILTVVCLPLLYGWFIYSIYERINNIIECYIAKDYQKETKRYIFIDVNLIYIKYINYIKIQGESFVLA